MRQGKPFKTAPGGLYVAPFPRHTVLLAHPLCQRHFFRNIIWLFSLKSILTLTPRCQRRFPFFSEHWLVLDGGGARFASWMRLMVMSRPCCELLCEQECQAYGEGTLGGQICTLQIFFFCFLFFPSWIISSLFGLADDGRDHAELGLASDPMFPKNICRVGCWLPVMPSLAGPPTQGAHLALGIPSGSVYLHIGR